MPGEAWNGPKSALSGDRQGFAATIANQRYRHIHESAGTIPVLDAKTYEDYDMCLVFPVNVNVKKAEQVMTAEEVRTELLAICRARVGRSIAELNRVARLHPVYKLGKASKDEVDGKEGREGKDMLNKSMTRGEFATLVRSLLFRVLQHIGAIFVLEDGHDKHGNTFVRVRLSEQGCSMVADYLKYPLQWTREATKYDEFRHDPNYISPYVPYEGQVECDPALGKAANASSGQSSYGGKAAYASQTSTSAMAAGTSSSTWAVVAAPRRYIWQRYDRLSRPLKIADARDFPKEASIFRDIDRIRLLKIALFEFLNTEEMQRRGWLLQSYALKQPAREEALKINWASLAQVCSFQQPLDDIRNYFGEEIAMYYAWLGFYTKALVFPAALGLVAGILGLIYNRQLSFENPLVNYSRLVYCVFLGVWATIFFSMWTRKEKLLSLRWGVDEVLSTRVCEEETSFFQPDKYITDPVQPDKFMRYFSPIKRRFRQIITSIVVVFSCFLVTVFINDDLMDAISKTTGWSESGVYGFKDMLEVYSPSNTIAENAALVVLITGLVIKLYDNVFRSIIVWRLGEFENHQYVREYNSRTNFFLFSFKVFGYFTLLFYLAFFKEYFNPCDDSPDGRCLARLGKQLVLFFVLDLVFILVEIGSPFVKYMLKLRTSKALPSQPDYQRQSYLAPYTGSGGLTGDFLEKVIQFGYCALFSMAVPFLPLFGLLVNLVEIRTDAIKLCLVHQRSFPRQADGLGMWDDLQKAMTFFGILSNIMLLTFATIGHDHTLAVKLTSSLVLLLIALGLKDFVQYRLPAESASYRLSKAKLSFVLHEEGLWSQPSSPTPPTTTHSVKVTPSLI